MTSDTPHPGFYKMRLVKGGPFVPCRVWFNEPERDEAGDLMDDECLMMSINGEFINGQLMGERWIWLMGNPISEAEYRFMLDDAEHAKEWRRDDPKATPTKAIDLHNMKPIF